jgi:hypothetical protein
LAREEYLDRLAVFQPQADAEDPIWLEVHEQVQQVLAGLDDFIQSRVPDLRVETGKTQGRNFSLFTHRTFSRADQPGIDPVVVGLTFARGGGENPEAIGIEADISGEQTGDRIAAIARREVHTAREDLVRAARELATELCKFAPSIVEALLNPSRNT